MRAGWPLLLLLAGCGGDRAPAAATGAGARLERAAAAAGLVVDAADAPLAGSWQRDTDRLCIVPGSGGDQRVGVLVDYGEGQGCAARGTLHRRGDTLAVALGGCRFDAAFDGERITFPAELPAPCARWCTGRASLAAVTVERLSDSVSEAATLRAPSGRPLCGSD